jgi:hypothetical membrane protein
MIRTTLRRILGGAATAGPLAFTAAWVASTIATPRYDMRRDDISALAVVGAPHPWITITGKLLLAASILALAVGLAISLGGRDRAVGVGMLITAGLAIAVAAMAREDCNTGLAACTARQQAGLASWHHTLHGLASVLFFLTILAAPIILARPLRADPHWRALGTYSVVTTVTGLALLLAYVATPHAWTGLAQRIFVTVPVAWTAILGTRLAGPYPTTSANASASSSPT